MKRIAVIGAGISGLATAYQLEKQLAASGLAHELRIFEKEARPGGKIGAAREGDFLCESGPNGFLDSKPSTLELCAELGLSERLLPSSAAASRRFILKGGRLREIPTAPLAFLRSDLMSLRGKLRMFGEPWAADPKEGKDQSISDFARRRLGSEALETLIEPMVGGVFAGDPDRLSLESCFPRIAELERTYGGLVKAMFKLQKQRRRQRQPDDAASRGGPAGPGGTLTSFREGLSVLPDTLAQRFGDRLTCGASLSAVLRAGNTFRLVFEGQPDYDCDCVVMATPASDAAQALNGLDAGLTKILGRFEYVPVSVVGLGFARQGLGHDLNGFGFLVPRREGRRILGSLWTSSIFSHRAPADSVLLRTIIGGARAPELARLPEDALVELARSELRETMGIAAEPVFVRVFRWERAICQYTVGHGARLKAMDERVAHIPGLFVTGNAYRGVALNDCTRNAGLVADQVAAYLREHTAPS